MYNDDEVASYDDEDDQAQQDTDGRLNPVRTGWNAEERYTAVDDWKLSVFAVIVTGTDQCFDAVVWGAGTTSGLLKRCTTYQRCLPLEDGHYLLLLIDYIWLILIDFITY